VLCSESQVQDSDAAIVVQKLQDKKLWSLAEMIEFMTWQLVRANDMLRDIEGLLKSMTARIVIPQAMIHAQIKPGLDYCRTQFVAIELDRSVRRIDDYIFIKLRDGITFGDLLTEMRFLKETVDDELIGHQFVYIAQDKTKEYLNWEHTWKRVLSNFPDVKQEVDQAIICFSLELYTATVFHMMRVAECGLRILAGKVEVNLKHSIEVEDWNTILVAVEQTLDQLHQAPRSTDRQRDIKLYSDAASHLRYMKAWRNEMAHARSVYEEGEAKSALTRVRELLELMCPAT